MRAERVSQAIAMRPGKVRPTPGARFCFAAAVVALHVHPAFASRLPLGLHVNAGVYAQEVWHDDRSFLCLDNRSGRSQSVIVSRWRSRQQASKELDRLALGDGEAMCRDASVYQDADLLELRLKNGAVLGLLRPTRAPPYPDADAAAFSTFQGLNGLCPNTGTWLEQPRLTLTGGTRVKVALVMTAAASTDVRLAAQSEAMGLPGVRVVDARSPSLDIERDEQGFEVRPPFGKRAQGINRLELTLDLDRVERPTLYVLSGQKRAGQNAWQCFVRGLLITP